MRMHDAWRRALAAALLALASTACGMPEDLPPAAPAHAAMVDVPGPAPLPTTAFAPSGARTMPSAPQTIAHESERAPRHHPRGAPIDIDVKDADLHDVFRLLADVGRVNVVVADDVHGAVTIRMKQVRWADALDAVVAAKGLVATWQSANVVLIGAPTRSSPVY